MNSITTLLLSFAMLACCLPAKAQLRQDHTYSTHNYKHPNKAAEARRWEGKKGVLVETPARMVQRDNRPASYKNQLPGQQAVGGVTVVHTMNEDLTGRNYKMPKPVISPNREIPVVRKRTKKQTDSTDTAIGD